MAVCYIDTSTENDVPAFNIAICDYSSVEIEGQSYPAFKMTQTYNEFIREVETFGVPAFAMFRGAPEEIRSLFGNHVFAIVKTLQVETNPKRLVLTTIDDTEFEGALIPIDETETDYYIYVPIA